MTKKILSLATCDCKGLVMVETEKAYDQTPDECELCGAKIEKRVLLADVMPTMMMASAWVDEDKIGLQIPDVSVGGIAFDLQPPAAAA